MFLPTLVETSAWWLLCKGQRCLICHCVTIFFASWKLMVLWSCCPA